MNCACRCQKPDREGGHDSRVPVQTGATVASTGNFPVPLINYEPTGLHTDISLNEGEPVVVGTLNVGPSGDVLVVVISVKRSPR